MPTDPALRAGLEALLVKWRADAFGTYGDYCIDELAALLRAVPPAQDPPAAPDGKYRCIYCQDFHESMECPPTARPSRREPSGDVLPCGCRLTIPLRGPVRLDRCGAHTYPSDLVAQIRALPRTTGQDMTGTWAKFVNWADLVALLPPEDGQP